MRPGPKSLCDLVLQDFDINSPPRPLVEVISELVLKNSWSTSSADAREKAESWLNPTISRLRTELSGLNEMCKTPRVEFNSSSEYMIQGACFVEPRDTAELRCRKEKRRRSSEYYGSLKQLTPENFEELCGEVLRTIGVERPIITRRSFDEGIDFYGKLSIRQLFFLGSAYLWIVGQAKHYPTSQVSSAEIRDLVGAITLARVGVSASVESPLKELEIKICDPVVGLFLTTGSLSANGWRLLKRTGIVGMDGEMLASFITEKKLHYNALKTTRPSPRLSRL